MSAIAGPANVSSIVPSSGDGLERLITRVICEAFWEREAGSDTVRWSGNVESIFGYDPQELGESSSWWRDRVHPDDLGTADRVAQAAIESGAHEFRCEYRFRRKDGSWAWVASHALLMRDADGTFRRSFGAMIDVSKAKETESRLRFFTEQLPARATVTDRDLRVLWDAGAAYPGNPSTVGRTVAELFADSPDRDRVLDGCARALAGETCRLEIDDGTLATDLQLVPFHDPAGAITGVVGIAFDITERKRAQEALWEKGEHLRTVLNTLPVGAVVMDRDGNVTLRNPAMDRIWGGLVADGAKRWTTSEGYWHGSGTRLRPKEWASHRAIVHGETSLNELIDIETARGERKIIENSAAPIRGANGEIIGAVVVNQEVTDRVRAEERLRDTRRLLMQAELLGQTGGWEQDLLTGEIFNSEARRHLYFGGDPTKGDRVEDYTDAIHPDDREEVTRRRQLLTTGGPCRDVEYRVIWPDGSEHVIFGRATVVRDESGKPVRVYGTNADITQRKRTEEELARRAAQLQALSHQLIQAQEAERRSLSNELHDDLGQMLFALKLNLERNGGADTESISLVDGAIARMRALVQALRPPMLDELGLEAALRWHVEREATRAGVRCHLNLAPLDKRPPATVEVTCFRIAQEALSNAIRHSRARAVTIDLSEDDDALNLVVRDDGEGFDLSAARSRAANGESQGLLSMQERAALVGGQLSIDSIHHGGTTVRARLPIPRRT